MYYKLSEEGIAAFDHLREWLASPAAENEFNMKVWGGYQCGTEMCIGGRLEYFICPAGPKLSEYDLATRLGVAYHNFEKLCYPDGSDGYNANPDEALRAVHNFLTFGEPRWEEICPERYHTDNEPDDVIFPEDDLED